MARNEICDTKNHVKLKKERSTVLCVHTLQMYDWPPKRRLWRYCVVKESICPYCGNGQLPSGFVWRAPCLRLSTHFSSPKAKVRLFPEVQLTHSHVQLRIWWCWYKSRRSTERLRTISWKWTSVGTYWIRSVIIVPQLINKKLSHDRRCLAVVEPNLGYGSN